MVSKHVHRVIDLVDPASQGLIGIDAGAARSLLLERPAEAALGIRGSFALVAAKRAAPGSSWLAASIARCASFSPRNRGADARRRRAHRRHPRLSGRGGYGHQFHPSYTRMVPAHHVTTLRARRLPDPQPAHARFFAPTMGRCPPTSTSSASATSARSSTRERWLARRPRGADRRARSRAARQHRALLALHHALLASGRARRG
jgi:asparagine synthase (glutamine-hydrolysing)